MFRFRPRDERGLALFFCECAEGEKNDPDRYGHGADIIGDPGKTVEDGRRHGRVPAPDLKVWRHGTRIRPVGSHVAAFR